MRFQTVPLAAAMLAAAAAAHAQPAQPSRVISADWFAGTWSDRADCSVPVEFLRDGRYVTPNGEARWAIERGNVLVLISSTQRQEIPIERINDRQVRMISNGVVSYRCDGATVGKGG